VTLSLRARHRAQIFAWDEGLQATLAFLHGSQESRSGGGIASENGGKITTEYSRDGKE
jgi:hypothetical protein